MCFCSVKALPGCGMARARAAVRHVQSRAVAMVGIPIAQCGDHAGSGLALNGQGPAAVGLAKAER